MLVFEGGSFSDLAIFYICIPPVKQLVLPSLKFCILTIVFFK